MNQQQLVFDPKSRVMRLEPVLPPGAYQTYEIDAPLATHWRRATCQEVDCPKYLNGWISKVVRNSSDESILKHACQVYGISWKSIELVDGFNCYRFDAGQRCFKFMTHHVPLERPATFYLKGGDWRGSDFTRIFDKPEQWIDHFAHHQDKLSSAVERG